METRETGKVVPSENAAVAPIYEPLFGEPPSWSGKPEIGMSMEDIESVHDFCMEDAWTLGFEDEVLGLEDRPNPFRRGFLRGVPFSVFMTYYTRGRDAVRRNSSSVVPLFAKYVA